MFAECRHILPSGIKCKSPALRNRPLCYFHSHMRRYSESGTQSKKEPLLLPSLEDSSGVRIAVHEVLTALSFGRIDAQQTRIYLYGLQIAAQLALRPVSHEPTDVVRAITCDNHGEELALEQSQCEPPNDCLHCGRRETCKMFENYDDEVEELEQQIAEAEEESEQEVQEEKESEENEQEEEDDEHEDEDDEEEQDLKEYEAGKALLTQFRRQQQNAPPGSRNRR